MHVSYGELIRVCPESIRMLGFTFGQADDCVEGIVWTQCVLGRGYTLLQMAERCRRSGGWPTPSMRDHGPGASFIGLSGSPVFALGARLADLAVCDLSQSSDAEYATVVAYGGFGGWIAPYIAIRILRNGCDAVVFWRPGSSTVVGEAPATLVSGWSTTGQGDGRLLIMPGNRYGASPLPKCDADTTRRDHRLGGTLASALGDLQGDGVLVVFALPRSGAEPDVYTVPGFARKNDAVAQFVDPGILDAGARFDRAIASGIEVNRDDHQVLTRLSLTIRLPNTDRSRAQAG